MRWGSHTLQDYGGVAGGEGGRGGSAVELRS